MRISKSFLFLRIAWYLVYDTLAQSQSDTAVVCLFIPWRRSPFFRLLAFDAAAPGAACFILLSTILYEQTRFMGMA